MYDFQQSDKGRDSEITIDKIIMIFMDVECFKEIMFKYRVGFANNFSRIKIKNVVIFPAIFSSGGPPFQWAFYWSNVLNKFCS